MGEIEAPLKDKSMYEYLVIPYTEPMAEELKFAASTPVKPCSNIRYATKSGTSCE